MLYFKDIAISAGNAKGSLSSYEPDSLGRIGDGMVNEWDFRYITNSNDKLNWRNLLPTSLSIGANWKDLSVNMQFNLSYGQYTTIVDKLARQAPYGSDDGETVNAPAFWSDYWTESNKGAAYPSPVWASDNEQKSTFWVRDAYQVRLRTLNISYKIPSKVANRLRLSSIRVYFTGTNLWTPVSTFDYKEDAIARFNTYPFLKEFNFGVNISL
jgi:hypothetical protein